LRVFSPLPQEIIAARRIGEMMPAIIGGRGKKKDAEIRQGSHPRGMGTVWAHYLEK
jgi:hypothetical protein